MIVCARGWITGRAGGERERERESGVSGGTCERREGGRGGKKRSRGSMIKGKWWGGGGGGGGDVKWVEREKGG